MYFVPSPLRREADISLAIEEVFGIESFLVLAANAVNLTPLGAREAGWTARQLGWLRSMIVVIFVSVVILPAICKQSFRDHVVGVGVGVIAHRNPRDLG